MKKDIKEPQSVQRVRNESFNTLIEKLIELGYNESTPELIELVELAIKAKKTGIDNCVNRLTEITNKLHFEKLIETSYRINKNQIKEIINVDHVLFKIIKQHFLSLYNLLSYQFSVGAIGNLSDSYMKSIDLQKQLANSNSLKNGHSDRLAWFINLKNPITYWTNKNVKKHYSGTVKIFSDLISNEGNNSFDLRRMHIFYKEYFQPLKSDPSKIDLNDQIKHLFKGLLFEYLIGINSRIIVITNYNELQKRMYFENNQYKNVANIFLLDYALFQYPINIQSESSVDYELHLLPAEFSVEPLMPQFSTVAIDEHEYSEQKVFHIEGPNLFYIFKRNFLAFWKKDQFVQSLDNLILQSIWKTLCDDEENIILQSAFKISSFCESIRELLQIASDTDNELKDFLLNKNKKLGLNLSTLEGIEELFKVVQNELFIKDKAAITSIEKSIIMTILNNCDSLLDELFKEKLMLEGEIFSIRVSFQNYFDVQDLFDLWVYLLSKGISIKDLLNDEMFFDYDSDTNNSEYLKIMGENDCRDYSNKDELDHFHDELKAICYNYEQNVLKQHLKENLNKNYLQSRLNRVLGNKKLSKVQFNYN
jgi:hypothetical protein